MGEKINFLQNSDLIRSLSCLRSLQVPDSSLVIGGSTCLGKKLTKEPTESEAKFLREPGACLSTRERAVPIGMDNMDDTQADPGVQEDSSAPASVPPSTSDDMEVDTTSTVPGEIEGKKGGTLAGASDGAAAPGHAPDVNTGAEVLLTDQAAAMDVEEEMTNSGALKSEPDDEDGQQGGDMEQVEEKEPPVS